MRNLFVAIALVLMVSGMLTLLGGQAQAAPLTLDLTGSVTSATGTWASEIGNPVAASLTIDLDAANASDSRSVAGPGEIPFSEWAFPFPAYSGTFSGALGPATDRITVKTHDNVDLAIWGPFFGLSTGVFDALSVTTHSVTVHCPLPLINDPLFGCIDENGDPAGGPEISGTSFEVFLIGAPDWFTDGTLPSEIPSLAELTGVFGLTESWSGGDHVASAEIEYTTLIPEPSTALLLGLGLVGLAARRRV